MYYEKSNDGNITKLFFDNKKFDWELYIIVTLNTMGLDIHPTILNVDYNKTASRIEFDTNGLTSLRELFETNNVNFHLIINELLSFINHIRMKKIIIGNLHIDIIYVNLTTMRLYILDLSNTIFTDKTTLDINLQSLYISLRETEVNYKIIKYFDQEMKLFNNTLSKYSYTHSLLNLYQ
jgi:hypothetical protein